MFSVSSSMSCPSNFDSFTVTRRVSWWAGEVGFALGPMKAVREPEELVNIVGEVADKNPELQATSTTVKKKGTDAFPAFSRELKTTDIISMEEKRTLPSHVHWKTDAYENIENTTEKAQQFVMEILRAIDAKWGNPTLDTR